MDNLTHTATGLFLSRAGLNRLSPHAAPILILAANAPDIDIVTLAGGPLNYLHFHRHLTHSLIAMPLMAILSVLLVALLTRGGVRWGGAFLAALIAVGTHLLLDWTNVYGVRMLLPFSSAWLRLDWTPVVDVSIWVVLGLGVAAPFLARLVASEINSGEPRRVSHGRGFAVFALAFVLLYNCGRGIFHARAVTIMESRLYNGEAPVRTAALPGSNPFSWSGLVETREAYRVVDIELGRPYYPEQGLLFYKPTASAAIQAASQTATFRTFLGFSQFPLWQVEPAEQPPDGQLVQVLDLRFGTPLRPAFRATALLNRQDAVEKTEFQFGAVRPH